MPSVIRTFADRLAGDLPHIPERVTDLDDPDHYGDNSRIKNLADGSFAIAMTLLAFSLISLIPHAALALGGPNGFVATMAGPLLVYAMTFIVLGTFWVSHAIMFHYVIRSDRPLMVRTVVLLLFVCLVPFSTQYLALHPYDQVGIALYGLNLIFVGVGLNRTFAYALQDRHLLHRVVDRRLVRAFLAALFVGPVGYAIAILVSFVNGTAAFALCVLIPLASFFPNPFWGRLWGSFVGSEEESNPTSPIPEAR